jgi:DNA polymerase/3'-5' exonuclease PolX
MAHGTINNIALFNNFKNEDFISHSMKIKNMLIYISSVIYSSRNSTYDKFNMVDNNEYFTPEEKAGFLKDLLNAGYNCGYTNDKEKNEFIKKDRHRIMNSDNFENIQKLVSELLPVLKMKINLNKTSMFVIEFYLIEKGTDKEIALPFHFSMRLTPHNISLETEPNKCKNFGEYDESISNINNKGNYYGIPHVTLECYNSKGRKRVSRSYGIINDTNGDATEGGGRSNISRKEDTRRKNLAPSFLDNSILADKENISYQKGDIIRPSIQHIPIPNKYNTDKKTTHSDIEVSRVSREPRVSRESKVSIESNVSRELREPKVSIKPKVSRELREPKVSRVSREPKVSREDFRDDISSVTEDLNMCNAFNISIGRNNHAYLNISNTSPDSYFNNLLELLSNKEYVSSITDLVFIKKTEDGKNISCIQKNNGDKKILETYINMSLNAVVKLLTKFKEQYDINIHPILIYPNAKSKLINYIKNIKDRPVYEEDYNSFNNIAKHYELYTLNNLLCSINATKDYKKFVNLSIKFYKEYITRYEAYKKKIFKILEKKNIEKIINDMIIIQEEFNDMILKYNLYIIYSVKAYSSYTHLNILGLAEYPNIEKGILMTHKFIMETNINKLKFTDRKLDNYYLALPISIKKYDNLERSIFLEVNNNNIEEYLKKILNSKNYTNASNFNLTYLDNIISDIFAEYFNTLLSIAVENIQDKKDKMEYDENIKNITSKYSNLKSIIIPQSNLNKVYNYNKDLIIAKCKKIYKNDTISNIILDIDIFKHLPPEQVKSHKTNSSIRYRRMNTKVDKEDTKGGMPPKKTKSKTIDNYKQLIIDNLKILSDYEKLNKEPFKTRAYNKAIDSIELSESAIKTTEDIKNIKGIGDKISIKIKELIETGKMTAVENALNDPKFSLQKQLGKLYGVGPVKINELMDKISSFEELYERRDELLNDKQKIGLDYYKDMELRIPMSEGKKHYKIIDKIFKQTNDSIEFELVGSYRRGNKDMGDIDILIKNSDDLNLKKLIANLVKSGYIIETLASGKSKFMGLCKLSPELPARRIDILIADPSYYYFALLYFTGSYTFNIYMRKIALEKGYSLSEYGLKGKDKQIIDTSTIINSEEDIFKFLNITYVPPNKRNIV